jgi:hypothetical protein
MEKLTKEELEEALLSLLYNNKVFAKCYACKKYLNYTEYYAANCSVCGKIDKDNILIVDLNASIENVNANANILKN